MEIFKNYSKNSQQFMSFFEKILEFLLFRFRWIFVIYVILPLSLLNKAYSNARNWIFYSLRLGRKSHSRKVAIIQKQMREWNKNGRMQKLCTARPSHQSMSFRSSKYKKEMLGIRTDGLRDILEINPDKMRVRVEPMVTIGQLIRTLVPMGYTLPVVPELEDLTIGGLINGSGVGSGSAKHGLFQHICLSFEIILSSGELIIASKENEQSLFYGIPWSYGTLGFLVAVTLRIIPCKPLVRLVYQPYFSLKELSDMIQRESCAKETEFVEAIQFSKENGVVILGEFVEQVPKNETPALNKVDRWYKPWFFKHVQWVLGQKKIRTEYVPLLDYYHRHSKSLYWEIRDIIPFGNFFPFRWFLGWAMPPKSSLLKLTMPQRVKHLYDRGYVRQDFMVPAKSLPKIVELVDKELSVYPLWLCPFSLPDTPGLVRNRYGFKTLYVDIGIQGMSPLDDFHPVATIKRLEKAIRDEQGVQMLYADCYQSGSEFWDMFDASLYDWIRAKYDCKKAFPTVYEKVCRNARD